jgi:hypothetical protein
MRRDRPGIDLIEAAKGTQSAIGADRDEEAQHEAGSHRRRHIGPDTGTGHRHAALQPNGSHQIEREAFRNGFGDRKLGPCQGGRKSEHKEEDDGRCESRGDDRRVHRAPLSALALAFKRPRCAA